MFFLLTLLLCSAFHLSILSEVRLLNFLRLMHEICINTKRHRALLECTRRHLRTAMKPTEFLKCNGKAFLNWNEINSIFEMHLEGISGMHLESTWNSNKSILEFGPLPS